MSIYPVRVKKWFVCSRSFDKDTRKEIKLQRDIIKDAIKRGNLECLSCGKSVNNFDTAYVSHAFVYGFNDAYCNKKCYKSRGNIKERLIAKENL